MANQRIQRLQTLLGLHQKETREFYQLWLRAKSTHEAHRAKHQQLMSYREDYLHQLVDLGNAGSSLGRLRNRLDFIYQLDLTLQQLSQRISFLYQQSQESEARYIKAKAREEAVEKLIVRLKNEERVAHERTLQKENDEYAQKQWYSRVNQSK